jgi:hypothetical protein
MLINAALGAGPKLAQFLRGLATELDQDMNGGPSTQATLSAAQGGSPVPHATAARYSSGGGVPLGGPAMVLHAAQPYAGASPWKGGGKGE